jgi:hypothetical protein
VASALARREREGGLSADSIKGALDRLRVLATSPQSLEIVTLDDRLREAAEREGFIVARG